LPKKDSVCHVLMVQYEIIESIIYSDHNGLLLKPPMQ